MKIKRWILEYRWIGAATALFWVLLFVTPRLDCDYFYMRVMPSMSESEQPYTDFVRMEGEEITTAGQWAESAWNHYRYHDNGRLANFIAMGQGIIPHWIYDLLLAVCYGVLITSMLNFAGISRKSAGAVGAIALSLWWFVGWKAPMLSVDYLLNYLFSAAATFSFVWLVTRRNCRLNFGMILLAVVAGLSHEGFSTPFSAGVVCWLFIKRKTVTRRQAILCSIFIVSTLVTLLSPGLIIRFIDRTSNSITNRLPWSVGEFVRDNWIFFPGVIYILYTLIRHSEKLHKSTYLILAIASIVSLLIYFIIPATQLRAIWPEQLSLITLCFACINPRWLNRRGISITLWCILTAWSGSLIFWQKKLADEEATLNNDTSQIYARDFSTLNDTPIWLNFIPSGPGTFIGVFEVKSHDVDLRASLPVKEHAFFPTSLNLDDTTQILPGSARARGAFPFFAFPGKLINTHRKAIFTLGPGSFLKCKNTPMAIAEALTGRLYRNTELSIKLMPICEVVTSDNDTLAIYEPGLWEWGATKFGRPILRVDTVAAGSNLQR